MANVKVFVTDGQTDRLTDVRELLFKENRGKPGADTAFFPGRV